MTETANLWQNYTVNNHVSQAEISERNVHQQLYDFEPQWDKYAATQDNAHILKVLNAREPALTTKATLQVNPLALTSCMAALQVQDEKPVQWMLTLFYDMLREDSSCFSVFEGAMKSNVDLYKGLISVMENRKGELYVRDKAAWVLSAIMANLPQFFTEDQVMLFLAALLAGSRPAGDEAAVGTLEAIVNLLKADQFRAAVWAHQGVPDHVFMVQVDTAPAHLLYRCVFAIWMLSYDAALVEELKTHKVVAVIKRILVICRVEKVVRMCLTVLKNFLAFESTCENMVELNILEAVQSLEYEKWRDVELYDDIREISQLISQEVQEVSNFGLYERELATGRLSWGFTHTSKFWGENVMKFEQQDFAALSKLATILVNGESDPTSLAVACHDIGEFVALHPLGKARISKMGIKERVMDLMGSQGEEMREVRREALLCCQKIMLNKWQEMEKAR